MFLVELLEQFSGNTGMLLFAGFLVGVLHAFEPDHVAAMLSQIQNKRSQSQRPRPGLEAVRNSLQGALWGFGHTSMILLISAMVFVLAVSIPETVLDGFELMVGVMLVGLGISVYGRKAFKARHQHPHSHENGVTHTHPHDHDSNHSHGHKSYLIGCIHGLAGSGGLIALSIIALSDVSWALVFALIFGVGSVIGMMAVSGALSVPFLLTGRFFKLRRCLQILAGAITIIIGMEIIYGIVV